MAVGTDLSLLLMLLLLLGAMQSSQLTPPAM